MAIICNKATITTQKWWLPKSYKAFQATSVVIGIMKILPWVQRCLDHNISNVGLEKLDYCMFSNPYLDPMIIAPAIIV